MSELVNITKWRGFEWNECNRNKNWLSHGVSQAECEQLFFNQPLLMHEDPKHLQTEKRYYVLGKTDRNRRLFVVFIIRNHLIRVISARDMSRKEREIYEKA